MQIAKEMEIQQDLKIHLEHHLEQEHQWEFQILMYLQVRWGDQYNLKFVDRAGNNKTIGKISDLMKWHLEEPPTEEEIRRNEEVFKIQGNRNPFIDHPEYAEKIFCYDGESYNAKLQSIVEQYGSNYEQPEITDISLSPSALTLSVGQSATLTASVVPGNASKRLTWTSSNTSVATVNGGKVTALSAGTTTITVASTDNPGVKATATVTVKAVTGISVSGGLQKSTYYAGETFSPAGLTVTLHHSDGSTATANLADCQWLDGTTGSTELLAGTTTVVCKYGSFSQTITGITVKKAISQSVTFDRSNFTGDTAYGWRTWSVDGISGKAFVYLGNQTQIQMNSSKTSYYIFNTTPLQSGIVSITVKMSGADKDWEILTSTTAYQEGAGKIASGGTSHGVKTATLDGTTWTINTTDPYFVINYKSTGAAYIESITITYGTGATDEDPPVAEHNFGAWNAEVPATCKAEGTLGHYTCSHCNGYFDANKQPMAGIVIPKAAHSFGEWVTTTPATETEPGEMKRECSVCHQEESLAIPPLTSEQSAFSQMVNALSVTTGTEAEFEAIRQAYLAYSQLSDAEKQADAVAYAKLQNLSTAYNAIANRSNQTMDEATQIAGSAFVATALSLGALLWLIARKFIIGG